MNQQIIRIIQVYSHRIFFNDIVLVILKKTIGRGLFFTTAAQKKKDRDG
jgi:hypothetical protein